MSRLIIMVVGFFVTFASCAADQALPALPNFDQRRVNLASPGDLEQRAAATRLKTLLPQAQLDLDAVSGTPRWVMSPYGTLTGPRGQGKSVSRKSAAPWADSDPDRATKAFLNEHRKLFRHGPEVLEGARRTRDFVTAHNGLRTVVWEQQLDGIPVYEGRFIAHVTKQGELAALSSGFLPDPARAANAEHHQGRTLRNQPGVSARQAVVRAIEWVGETVPDNALNLTGSEARLPDTPHQFKALGLPGTIRASLVWVPVSATGLRLCWSVEVTRRQRSEAFQVLIDAQSGAAVLRRKLTYDLREATYRVFTTESPTPMSPGWPAPSAAQPPVVERSLVTLSALSTNASPLGWIADGDNETRGNNVDAHLDRDAEDAPDLPRPQGFPFRVFDFPLDTTLEPETYQDAAVVQLFYWCNWMHDQLYELGFTEAAGNLQKDNLGRGGQGDDPLLADAQDGSGFNNANYTPAPDGRSPRMQMFLFNGPTPFRDGDLDAAVILHEYTHALSDRLVGGGTGIYQWQTYGMAEGWSDFYALALLNNPADPPESVYPVGPYASYLFNGVKESYYFGIRRYPVTTDMSKNPLTFKDVDPAQMSYHLGVPRNPAATSSGSEVHAMGEVWCAALWQVRANLIQKIGPVAGNQMVLRLVTDGMRLSPPNPTFVQARNAILLADVVMNNAANRSQLWTGFAKRGLGYSATALDASSTAGLREAFDYPDNLTVTPTNAFLALGRAGGPFSPTSQTYTLVNGGGSFISWTVNSLPLWATAIPANGGIAPGATNTVSIALNSLAYSLVSGTYPSAAVFVNQGSGQSVSVPLTLEVFDQPTGDDESLTEIFDGNGDFDLDYTTITFVPETSSNGLSYAVCTGGAGGLPTDPSGGEILTMVDDCYTPVTLAEGKEVSLFGTRTNGILVGSNGDIVFTVPAYLGYLLDPTRQVYTNFFYSVDSVYFGQPRVAPLYADFNPGVDGTVSWKQLSNRVAVTWQNVPEYGLINSNTFQVEWFFDGMIRFTYAGVAPKVGANYTTPKVGLVREGGSPPGFVETDFSAGHSCLPRFGLLLPTSVTEGEGPWEGMVMLSAPSDTPVQIEFSLSETNAYAEPSLLEIPPGELTATFHLFVEDDHRLLGTRRTILTAAAAGYATATEIIQVADREVAVLSVKVPSRAREGEGLVSGQVSMDLVPEVPIAVQLSSTAPTLVQVPALVTIPAGTNTVSFDMWVGEDALISGPLAVGILAHVANWQDDADAMIVADNESTNLLLVLPTQVVEDAGLLTKAGRVTLGGYLNTNLVVSLWCDHTNTVQVPDTITLGAGQSSALFDLTVVDDNLVNGPRQVMVHATAAGFADASSLVQIADNESPSYPTNPGPAHLAVRVNTGVTLTWQVQGTASFSNMTFDVYFGTNPVPGQAELLGNTASNSWSFLGLALNTTYFWKVIVRLQEVQVPGPVWQFTTASLHHLAISEVPSPQLMGVPFPVTVRALDDAGNVATTFTGPVSLEALASTRAAATVVIAEVDTSASDRVEFVNVSGQELDLSSWKIVFYDWKSWPGPRIVFDIPEGTIAAAGDLFQVRRAVVKPPPGTYPIFTLPVSLAWNNSPNANPVAVLLMDAASNIVDFVCAVDADPAQITDPKPIPVEQWSGAPVPPNTTVTSTYQRVGFSDHNNNSDWRVATNSLGSLNQALSLTFHDLAAVGVSQGLLTGFSNGVWNGDLVLQVASPSVILRVDDGNGHIGTGAAFALAAADNLSVAMQVSPGRKTAGNTFSYFLTVSNTGPSAAHGVVLLDHLPPEAVLVSVTASQGTATALLGAVVCELGTVPGGGSASVTLLVSPTRPALLTNRVAVSRVEPDGYTEDDTALLTTPVSLPLISLDDVGVREGQQGVTNLLFAAHLSEPSQQTVTAGYFTSDGMARAGQDYEAASGLLTFPPGATNAFIPVAVYGNQLYESNKTVFLNLTNPAGGWLVSFRATGTITNDDSKPGLSISDATVWEGDDDLTRAIFQLTLSTPSGVPTVVPWTTSNGTAQAGLDFRAGEDRVILQPGETNQTFSVTILGNTVSQPTRRFYVTLSAPPNVYLMRSQATGTILDDDAGRLHHFAWGPVPPTQYVHEPFLASLTAQNARNETVSDYEGLVAIRGSYSNRVSAVGAGGTNWEAPLGAGYHDMRLQTIYSAADLANAGRISALALEVVGAPGQTLSNWTIRLRHTSLNSYGFPIWETNWTTVYRMDQTLLATGWAQFSFQTPFDYNGVDNLMVDFSFNNDSYSRDGLCRASSMTNLARTVYYRTDSGFGDPLRWGGSGNPVPIVTTQFPCVRFTFESPSVLSLQVVSNFVNGVAIVPLTFGSEGLGMVLHALNPAGYCGDSDAFDAIWRDSDGDGMSDEWELANKLDPLNPADVLVDGDGDGLTNLQEYLAGTDPHDPASSIKLLSIQPVGSSLIAFGFMSASNRHYQLESTTSLGETSWRGASPVQAGNGGLLFVTNHLYLADPARFYRLKVTP
jgi:uncharacterized repeat protein (TIGR01451 family)